MGSRRGCEEHPFCPTWPLTWNKKFLSAEGRFSPPPRPPSSIQCTCRSLYRSCSFALMHVLQDLITTCSVCFDFVIQNVGISTLRRTPNTINPPSELSDKQRSILPEVMFSHDEDQSRVHKRHTCQKWLKYFTAQTALWHAPQRLVCSAMARLDTRCPPLNLSKIRQLVATYHDTPCPAC